MLGRWSKFVVYTSFTSASGIDDLNWNITIWRIGILANRFWIVVLLMSRVWQGCFDEGKVGSSLFLRPTFTFIHLTSFTLSTYMNHFKYDTSGSTGSIIVMDFIVVESTARGVHGALTTRVL